MTITEQNLLEQKIDHASDIIKGAIKQNPRIAVACSFGKDSMVVVDLARKIDQEIPIFSVMTMYKPQETFEYLAKMNNQMNLNVDVYMVADKIPDSLNHGKLEINLLPSNEFLETSEKIKAKTKKEIYEINPDECCRLLKVIPTKEALKNYDAWICGLRNTEGRTRKNYKEIEQKGGLIKVNPILQFTEEDVLHYLEQNNIPVHPWYTKEFSDGKSYRSLGCEPCTIPIYPNQLERDGRWQGTSKCGGECGIHTQRLK